ncbi:MAG: methionine adenosyltransferase [Chloroflexota bacterium]|nr:methionine adenosyltransferase [Chloroflexota bacterium]
MTDSSANARGHIQTVSGLWTSESVTEGHPDKVCDQISDAVLDACLAVDPESHVACETAISSDLVVVIGEITTSASLDIEQIARNTLRRIGYTDPTWGIDAETCKVLSSINRQSPDIDAGVRGLAGEASHGGDDPFDRHGAGDQGMMFGFACDETESLMPLPIELAHRLTRQLSKIRTDGVVDWLRPDGKSQVTVEYAHGRPTRIDAIVVSTQHSEQVGQQEIAKIIRKHVIDAVIPERMIDDRTHIYVNPSGQFIVGGPLADAGLTGRKIIVDTYGGMARHGGGAFSGKDPSKVDRSAAYAARHAARNIVTAGLADRVELQVSYAIGKAEPTSLALHSFGTGRLPDDELTSLVSEQFDLRPAAIIHHLDLKRPIYEPTAAYGHFGRPDLDLPWEQSHHADALRSSANLSD